MKRIILISALCVFMFAFVFTGCKKEKNLTFTVTFDTQGGTEVIAIKDIVSGSKITEPEAPTKDNFLFAGWYKEPDCENLWNFTSDVVKSNITLYAKWVDEDTDFFTVTFDSQGGTDVDAITNVADGSKITKPADPTKDNFLFVGWYKESDCKNAWSFANDVVISDITLYAKWVDAGDAEVVTLDFFKYYGDYAKKGTEDFYVGFKTVSNTVYVLDFYSPNLVTLGLNIAPATGTYIYNGKSTGAAFTIGAFESGISTSPATFSNRFQSGTVIVSRVGEIYTVSGDLTDTIGKLHKFIYTGEFSIVKPTVYDEEPTTSINATLNLTKTLGNINYENWYGVGRNLLFTVTDETELSSAIVDFIVSGSGLDPLPIGTYPINNSFGLNTVVAYTEESVAKYGGTHILYQGNIYFLISGSVVVTSDGFTLTGTSYNNSTFTVNYTGTTAVKNPG